MASGPEKWEVVGKGGKPRKNQEGNKKHKAKINQADLPKLDIKEPIPESKTQFGAIGEEQETPFVIPKDEIESDADIHADLFVDVSRKPDTRRRKHHHKEPQLSVKEIVNEAAKKCDLSTVKKFVAESKQKYSNNQLVVLKELMSFVQHHFEDMSVEKDSVLGEQITAFPLCCLVDSVQDLVIDEMRQCTEAEVDKLFHHCLEELLIEINKGRATYGIRMMIQCVLKCCPLVAIKSSKEYLERVISRKHNSREALSLLWAFGQTSDHEDVVERMTAWTSFMLPVIEFKQLSKYVVEYLEITLSSRQTTKMSDALFNGEQFQDIMEITFATTFQQFPYRRQLQILYPEVKALAFASYPNTPLTDIFAHLFDSLSNEWGEQYLREALSCLVECLEKDPTCHYKWRNNYLTRLKESSLLLKALVEQWESVCRSIPRKYLSETLQEFHNVNNELKQREKHKAGLSECETSCNTLLDVISQTPAPSPSQSPSRTGQIFKLLLLILFAVVCVDMYRHNGYRGSETSKVLKRYGIERALGTTYEYSKVYVQRLESWTSKHYPYYYEKVRDVVEPASEYTITKLHELLNYLAEVTAPTRAYLHKTIPPLLEKFENVLMHYVNCTADFISRLSKTYFPVVKQYLQLAWDALEHYVPLAWAQAQEIIVNISQGIYNMSPDFFDAIADGFRRLVNEITTRTPHILALMQEYFITACKLVVSGLTSIVQWFQENLLRVNTANQGSPGGS